MTDLYVFMLAGLLLCASCTTARAVSGARSLPKDTPAVCASHCDSIGMRLAAVVIIADSEGCVCEPREASGAQSREAAAAAAITPIVAAAAAAAAQRQQELQRQQQETSGSQLPPHIGR